jgi:hypothetical protein
MYTSLLIEDNPEVDYKAQLVKSAVMPFNT